MIHRALIIGRWMVDFLFCRRKFDVEGVLACMRECGASNFAMEQAEDLMRTCDYNCGFTFANPDSKRALVVIGPTTGGSEFVDTLVHEVHHLAVAIASELGIDLEGEGPAYIAGDAARDLANVVCELGCSRCH